MSTDPITLHGFTAVALDPATLLDNKNFNSPPPPLLVSDLPFPETELVNKVRDHVRAQLSQQTFNHSMRSYYFGQAILRTQFPTWSISPETHALACLLHDLAATPANVRSTLLSFEYHGGILALDLLSSQLHAPRPQAESVCEAIIRHQDLASVTGQITALGKVLQFATVLDNLGHGAELVHEETVRDVNRCFPRNGWSGCFADMVRAEVKAKPWAHTTSLGVSEFATGIEENKLMAPYD